MPRLRVPGMITIRDIARESGFSIGTVSIVLNDAPLARYMSAQTKERQPDAADAKIYRVAPQWWHRDKSSARPQISRLCLALVAHAERAQPQCVEADEALGVLLVVGALVVLEGDERG